MKKSEATELLYDIFEVVRGVAPPELEGAYPDVARKLVEYFREERDIEIKPSWVTGDASDDSE